MENLLQYSNYGSVPGFYAVPVPDTAQTGYSPIYRNAAVDTIKTALDYGNFHNMWDVFQHGLKKNPDAPCIGKRAVNPDGTRGAYSFMTYKQVETFALLIGSALSQLLIEPQISEDPTVKDARMVGLFVPNCLEWLILEQACNAYAYTLVPIYNTLGHESIHTILLNSRISVLLCTPDTVKIMFTVLEQGTEGVELKTIILIESEKVPDEFAENKYGFKFILWKDLEEMGRNAQLPVSPAEPDHLALISYTSGTSGVPKGVMITQANITNLIVVTCEEHVKRSFPENPFERHISYLPMAHLFEKNFVNAVYYSGGCIGLYSGDITKLLDDVQELKPTFFLGVPRLFQRIHDRIMADVQRRGIIKRTLFNIALNHKINNLEENHSYSSLFWDRVVFNKIKKLLGGEVRWMFVGSASMNPEIIKRLRAIFGVPLLWGYSLTECCAGTTAQNFYDTDPTECGGPIPNQVYRVRSLPDMEYDAEAPNPRGELLIRGNSVMKGYYRNPKATSETIVDGWLHTGDVVEIQPSGAIRIIDRVKNVFKLAQGEYVSPELVESIISLSPLVAQSFVYGDSHQVAPVAIVIPDEDVIKRWKGENGMESMSFKDVCRTPELRKAILEDITRLFDENRLRGFEKVKAIYVDHELFAVENDLLTVTAKLRRHKVRERYAEQIKELYAELAAASKA
ncbi:AMP-binding enzyme family protein [Babesia bovis T2Bo]|uniref:Long-chain-fatty-acid--CoA ligase n=1 Tax=Babesia bovis TaxID=5865 RepID=Q5EF32_BABBO|nr:AMP-binding enzyme family protein [Babesia bovis T2Bo]AAW82722.1 fatty acyl-CoA synthetase 3 [Babesia bovis]EDO05694.1 AMP-binding enzyme family protein [Babesia bovis T2Bo]|eukprot:XP_001609262.1 fatty acyl-CoA synthetase 3 [Babesia bovis T2Bo]